MKTTEMIAKVKESQDYAIVNELGLSVRTDSLRDLGFVLYEVCRQVKIGGYWLVCEAVNTAFNLPALLIVSVDDPATRLDGETKMYGATAYTIQDSYPLEFDGFGELENWHKVSEEEATLLLTKAPVETPQDEPGVDLFKQVFALLGLNFDDYYLNEICDEYAQFMHDNEDRYVDIIFNKGLVQVGHAGNSEPPRKLKISFA
jgi:hypothetical protein